MVNWNSRIYDESTPLHLAVYYGNAASTKAIMRMKNINFRIRNQWDDSVANIAVKKSWKDYNLDCLKHLVELEDINFNEINNNGDSLLMWTLKNDKLDRMSVLLEWPKLDLNAKDRDGNTAAHWAMKNNKMEALKILLARPGLDTGIVDNQNNSLIKIARYVNENTHERMNISDVIVNQ